MASNYAPIRTAGDASVDDERDALLARLLYHASSLAHSRVQNGLGLMHCEECEAEWLLSEPERHVKGCRVGNVRETLQALCDAYPRQISERSSAEPVDQDAGAAGEQRPARGEYGEPWGFTRPYIMVAHMHAADGLWLASGGFRGIARAVACVNFCAGISTEMIRSLIPLREMGIGSARSRVDELLSRKGGAR